MAALQAATDAPHLACIGSYHKVDIDNFIFNRLAIPG